MRIPSRRSTALLQHDCYMHARGASPHNILLSRIAVVVGAWRLTGCAGMVIAYMASAGVAIIVVRKNTIRGFLRVTCHSVASKVHIWLYGVRLPLYLPPRSLLSDVVLAVSTIPFSIFSTLSVPLLLLH